MTKLANCFRLLYIQKNTGHAPDMLLTPNTIWERESKRTFQRRNCWTEMTLPHAPKIPTIGWSPLWCIYRAARLSRTGQRVFASKCTCSRWNLRGAVCSPWNSYRWAGATRIPSFLRGFSWIQSFEILGSCQRTVALAPFGFWSCCFGFGGILASR